MNPYKETDNALFMEVDKFMRGDESKYQIMCELSKEYVYKMIHDIVKEEYITEEIMQNAYEQMHNKINTLEYSENFYVWAGRIASNLTLRYLQENRKEILLMEEEEDNIDFIFDKATEDNEKFIPEDVLSDREKQRLIGEVVDNLSVEQKLCVQYFYYEEMSVSEIAVSMGCSEEAVKSRLNQARKSIKEIIGDVDDSQGTGLYSLASVPLFLMAFRAGVADLATSGTVTAIGAVSAVGATGESTAMASGATAIGEAAVEDAAVIGETVVEEVAVGEVANGVTAATETAEAAVTTTTATTTVGVTTGSVAAKIAIAVGAVVLVGGGTTTVLGMSASTPVVEDVVETEEEGPTIDWDSFEVKIELPEEEKAPVIDIYVEPEPEPKSVTVVIPEEAVEEEPTYTSRERNNGWVYEINSIDPEIDGVSLSELTAYYKVYFKNGEQAVFSKSDFWATNWEQQNPVEKVEGYTSNNTLVGISYEEIWY